MVTGHGPQWSCGMGPLRVSSYPEGDSTFANFQTYCNSCTPYADADTHLHSTGNRYAHTD